MNFFNMIRGWIPTGTEVQIGSITSAIGAVLTYFIGWNDALEALLTLMVIDYATGLLAAYINPDLKLDSHKGFRGICKKIMIILLIVLAHELEKATGIPAGYKREKGSGQKDRPAGVSSAAHRCEQRV